MVENVHCVSPVSLLFSLGLRATRVLCQNISQNIVEVIKSSICLLLVLSLNNWKLLVGATYDGCQELWSKITNHKALIPQVPGVFLVGWHFPTVPGNKTMPTLAVTNWHFHSTIHTRPHSNFSLQQWTPLSTKTLPISLQKRAGQGTSPVHCVGKELGLPTPPPFSCPSTLIPAHWRPLDYDIKHSVKVTFIDLFELIFTYKLASNMQEKRFSVGPLSHRVMAFLLYSSIVGVPLDSMVGPLG